jgi:hypothetical protein
MSQHDGSMHEAYGPRDPNFNNSMSTASMDHVTLNFDNSMSTASVFLDIKKAFDTTWHPGLL